METMEKKEVDLLKGPILLTLTRLALPIMATFLLQMAYNLIDMIWIGRVGSGAVAAVGAAGMFLWLGNGFVILARNGGQVKVGHSLGSGEEKEAVIYARTAIQMGIFLGILYGVLCVALRKPMISFYHLTGADVIAGAENYLAITGGGIVFSFMTSILTGIFMAMGNSTVSLKVNTVGLMINMILDPVLIFGLGPFPKMEVVGAALATLTAQIVAAVLMLVAVFRYGGLFQKIKLKERSDWRTVRVMLKIAFPIAVQDVIFAGISMVIARLIADWGDGAVAVQKVGSQIESISWMTADGFAAALGAFIAQNYGARNLERVKKGYQSAMLVVLGWGLFCTFLLVVLPAPIFKIFIQEAEVLPMGIDYLRILGYSQLFMCMEIATTGAFSGIGQTIPPSVEGILLTALRIPAAMVLMDTALGLNGVWWSISISSILKGIVLTVWFLVVLRRLLKREAAAKQFV